MFGSISSCLADQNFVQQLLSSIFAASHVSPSNSTFSSNSDSSVGDGLDTPVDGGVAELFDVEAGCDHRCVVTRR
jgi:hypothetical protein